MAFAPPDWLPIRVGAVESGQPGAESGRSGAEPGRSGVASDRSGVASDRSGVDGDGASDGDGWIDDVATAVADADDLVLERLAPEPALERLEETCVRIDPDPDRIDCLVIPGDPGACDTAGFVTAVRERDPDVPVIVHPETGSVDEAADATAAGADRYLVREGAQSAESADDGQAALLAAVRALAADHDAVRTELLGGQLLAAILDDLQQVIYFKDRDGRHVCVSAQVANSQNESVLGKTDLDLYEAETGEPARLAYEDDLAVARQGKRIVDKEERFATDHGDANWLRTTKVPWAGPDGSRRGLIGFTEAINEQKAREAELHRERQRLEAFASFVSHDLRNPVSIASGYLDLARENGDPGALANVEEALDRMDRLIDDVLALVEPGSPDDALEWLSLRAAVEGAWRSVETPAASLTVTVPEGVEVFADEGLLGLLLENVLKNAVEHGSTSPRSTSSREDAVGASSDEPSVATAPEDAVEHTGDGVAVEVGCTPDGFYVADDGPGIQADDPGRVFEYGYTEGGTGLGLAIVTEVAAYHRWVPTVDDWPDDRSAAEANASLGSDGPRHAVSESTPESAPASASAPTSSPVPGAADVGAPTAPPEARGYDGACFRIGRCILRTPAHRSATEGTAVAPSESTDVGDPTMAGETSSLAPGAVDAADGEPIGPDAWRVRGVGKNLWRNLEQYHLAYANVPGDLRIVARLADLEYASEYTKAGVLVGRWPSAGEPLSFLGSIGAHGCESIHRPAPGERLSIRNHADRTAVPIWLRLDRVGHRVTSYLSADGESWTPVDQHVLPLVGSVVAGLAVCSHNGNRASTAVFDRVRITPLADSAE